MRFWVYGLDRISKAPRDPLFIEAESEATARAQASDSGMLVEEVEAVQPRRVPAARAAAPESLKRLRKAILPIAALLLLGAGAAVGWFSARRGMPELGQKEPDKIEPKKGEPHLEPVKEAERALKLAGFEHAFVYRWRGAALEGHLVLEQAGKPERIKLGPTPKGKVDPTYEGLLVIAVRPRAPGIAGRECMWGMGEEFVHEGRNLVAISIPSSGRLPDLSGGSGGGSGGGSAFYKLNLPEGGEWELFNLNLVKRE